MRIDRRTFCLASTQAVQYLASGMQTEKKENRVVEIKRVGSQASAKGPAEWFTGSVRIDTLFQAPDPARVAGASVHSSPVRAPPGTRTRWVRR